jgi:predicted nucleic acid-binding protein
VIVLLDSTVLIDYLRGRPVSDRIESVMSRGDIPATTGINVEEVVRGLLPREVPAAEALFEGLVILPIGAEEGWQAGQWRRQFASEGTTLAQADCLIAAAAVRADAVLATANVRDFPMPELQIEHWPTG